MRRKRAGESSRGDAEARRKGGLWGAVEGKAWPNAGWVAANPELTGYISLSANTPGRPLCGQPGLPTKNPYGVWGGSLDWETRAKVERMQRVASLPGAVVTGGGDD